VPDKGMFKVEKIMDYAPPVNPGEKAKYVPRQEGTGEWWICDGQSVFEHDAKNKELIQRELPPQMRGKAIAEGPLPFLFGAEREKIKQRYWIQPLPMPPDVKGEYWLEAYPKTRQDAANYQKVHVIIDHSDFLPKGLVIFDRNFDPVRNPTRTTLTFDNRQVNWSVALDRLNIFYREFYEPKVPFGWKKRIEKYDAPPNADQFAPAGLDNAGPVSQIPAGPGDPLPR
jgi:TIGR03009 family protein